MVSPQEHLIRWAEDVIKQYDPVKDSVDTHAAALLGDTEREDADPDAVFVQQVFYGVVRYKKFLKLFNASLFHLRASSISRQDYVRYMVLAYVTFFRLDDIGFDNYAELLGGLDPAAMYHFASYAFSPPDLERYVKDEWIRVVDLSFVEDTVLDRIRRHLPAAKALLAKLHAKGFGAAAAGTGAAAEAEDAAAALPPAPRKPPTAAQPFKLTRPRRRRLPQPQRIEQVSVANPVPAGLDRRPLAAVEAERAAALEAARAEVAAKYAGAKEQAFALHETRSNVAAVRAEVEAERAAECHFGSRLAARPAPAKAGTAPVKLNAAAILREDALYRRKQAEEAKAIEAYEENLRDAAEFYRWQSAERAAEEAERVRELAARKADMEASAERAAEARRAAEAARAAEAVRQREEAEAALAAEAAAKAEALRGRQAGAEAVRAHREEAPRAAEAALLRQRQARRNALRAEMEEAARAREAEEAAERAARADLIRQIRAMERVPVVRAKAFDPTEASGVGLLEEMSLSELRERLAINRRREEEAEERRRAEIVRGKQEAEADLQRRVDRIARVRGAAASKNRQARERRREAEARRKAAAAAAREEAVLEAADRMAAAREAKVAEAKELAAKEAAIAKRRMFLGAAKAQVEEHHFKDLRSGAEREARQRQRQRRAEAAAAESSKTSEARQREMRVRRAAAAERAGKVAAREAVAAARRRTADGQFEEAMAKKEKVRGQRAREAALLRTRDERNRYAATQTMQLRAQARARAGSTLQRSGKTALENTVRTQLGDADEWDGRPESGGSARSGATRTGASTLGRSHSAGAGRNAVLGAR